MANAVRYERVTATTPNERVPRYGIKAIKEKIKMWYSASNEYFKRYSNQDIMYSNQDIKQSLKMLYSAPRIRKQSAAFAILFCAGVVPFIADVKASNNFSGIFTAKVISCDETSYESKAENSTVAGWEALFALDATFGRFTFGQAKTIDVAWDVLIGRGLQLITWYSGYIVFSDALLRVIERHPATYQTFVEITLQGPSLMAMWALAKDLFRTRSRRTIFLFLFLVFSTSYILAIPVFIGAMTGYVNRTVAWVQLDDSENVVRQSDFKSSWIITGVVNATGSTSPMNECSPGDAMDNIVTDLRNRAGCE